MPSMLWISLGPRTISPCPLPQLLLTTNVCAPISWLHPLLTRRKTVLNFSQEVGGSKYPVFKRRLTRVFPGGEPDLGSPLKCCYSPLSHGGCCYIIPG
ncbi:hypothetical protein BV22DRAFT_915358 [Leucogyrophana mollusca]|uniref:Uncharacterized protein n=1 Tax=Leucogyrophana mollusca TaxID=85980 RepID=A0ACB8AXY5_9AGAM|nr:hypothetical protein BV22DRAFT_915358 [Leucogyrophana mollusca]